MVVAEIDSGLNASWGERRGMSDPTATVLVVEHGDRLACVEGDDLHVALLASGTEAAA
jgi:hypothetical protein